MEEYVIQIIDDRCWCECKKHHVCEKDYVWNPAACNCKNGVKNESYDQETNFREKKQPIKHNFF